MLAYNTGFFGKKEGKIFKYGIPRGIWYDVRIVHPTKNYPFTGHAITKCQPVKGDVRNFAWY